MNNCTFIANSFCIAVWRMTLLKDMQKKTTWCITVMYDQRLYARLLRTTIFLKKKICVFSYLNKHTANILIIFQVQSHAVVKLLDGAICWKYTCINQKSCNKCILWAVTQLSSGFLDDIFILNKCRKARLVHKKILIHYRLR